MPRLPIQASTCFLPLPQRSQPDTFSQPWAEPRSVLHALLREFSQLLLVQKLQIHHLYILSAGSRGGGVAYAPECF